MRRACSGLAPAVCILLWMAPARAQDEATKGQARNLGQQGFSALNRQDWEAAENYFRQADALFHAPTLLLGLARAQSHRGKFVEAWENYHRVIVEGAPPGASQVMLDAVQSARSEIDAVAVRRATVTLSVTGPEGAKVTVDGTAVPPAGLGIERPTNPGKHAVHAEAADYKPFDGSFSVDEGKATKFTVTLERAPSQAAAAAPATGEASPSASGTRRGGSLNKTLGVISLGVGAAGLATGVVTGILAVGRHGDLQNNPCSSGPCGSLAAASYNSDLDGYHTMSTVSTVGFVVAGVGAAAGVLLLLTAPRQPKEDAATRPQLELKAGWRSLALSGAF
jgi:hypothetical protein